MRKYAERNRSVMKKSFVIMLLAVIVLGSVFFVTACKEQEEEKVTIDRFEIEDLEIEEEAELKLSSAVITCYKSDGTTAAVTNNLTYDKTEIESKLNENDTLKPNSAGTYNIKVYHLGIEIGTLKVIVKVKR